MNLTNLTWINGTENNPVIISKEQLDKLYNFKLINKNSIIEGYVKVNDSALYDSYVNKINSVLDNLKITNEIRKDVITVNVAKTNFNEGENAIFDINTASSIYPSYDYEISHNITNNNSQIVNSDIINSFKIVKNEKNLTIKHEITNVLNQNISWSDVITIKFKINNNTITKTIIYKAVSVSNVIIEGFNSIEANEIKYINYTLIPANSTKLAKAVYSASCLYGTLTRENNNNRYKYEAPKDSYEEQININITILQESYSKTFIVNVQANDLSEFYIEQSDSISDPRGMITGPTGIENNKVIKDLFKNTHMYVFDFNDNTSVPTIKQLSDLDKRLYNDGTSALDDIRNKQVFVKIPTFCYQFEHQGNEKYICRLSLNELKLKGSYKTFESRYISAYDCTIVDNIIKSISDSLPSPLHVDNYNECLVKLQNTHTNLRFYNYYDHSALCVLFFATYGLPNANLIYKTSNYINTGVHNALGKQLSINDNGNFFGLEQLFYKLKILPKMNTLNYNIYYDGNMIGKYNPSYRRVKKLNLNENEIITFDTTNDTGVYYNTEYGLYQGTIYTEYLNDMIFSGGRVTMNNSDPAYANRTGIRMVYNGEVNII